MRAMVWFRTDLRVVDNSVLYRACADSTKGVVGVFVIAPGQWLGHDYSAFKVRFILESLRDLSDRLARLNMALRVVHAEDIRGVPSAVIDLARTSRCDAIYFNREYEVDERRRDEAVRSLANAAGIRTHVGDDQVLIPPGDVRTAAGRVYTVFTPFRNAALRRLDAAPCSKPLGTPRRQQAMVGRPSDVPATVLPWLTPSGEGTFKGGERDGNGRLRRFARDRLGAYADARDMPALPGTSGLSPHLAVGTVSVRTCFHLARAAGGRGATAWVNELLWREFFIHVMSGFPRVCMHRAFQPRTERVPWSNRDDHFEAWRTGRTGIPIVDAGMRQLVTDGWMHNRVRMIAAMFLSKNLLIDWRRGEAWFMRHLVDGFLASNNGGWQWAASTGTDAAPYFRVFNPVAQSRKFDPSGAYIRRWVHELRDVPDELIHEPWGARGARGVSTDYPGPIVDISASRARAIEVFRSLR